MNISPNCPKVSPSRLRFQENVKKQKKITKKRFLIIFIRKFLNLE